MKFSVIVPVYNGERFIASAIKTVLGQIYTDWELLVIDDGSTDRTLLEIKKYSVGDPRVKLIDCPKNSGSPAHPRNLGLKEARGEFIAFLDADDRFFPNKLSEVLNFFKNHPGADLVCHGEEHLKNNIVVRRDYYGPYTTYAGLLFRGNSLSTSAIVVRKLCIDKAGFFSEEPEFVGFEDYDYWMRLAKACKIYYFRKILGSYTVGDYGENSRRAQNSRNALLFLDKCYDKWEDKSPYYAFLIRRRKALYLGAASRQFIRMNELDKALSFSGEAIKLDPFNLKHWLLNSYAFIGRCLKR